MFGANIKKTKHGSVLIFDIKKFEKFESMYGESELEKDVKIEIKERTIEEYQYNNNFGNGDGGEGCEGYGKCVSILTNNNNYLDIEKKHLNCLIQDNNNYNKYDSNTHTIKPSLPSPPSPPSLSVPNILFPLLLPMFNNNFGFKLSSNGYIYKITEKQNKLSIQKSDDEST